MTRLSSTGPVRHISQERGIVDLMLSRTLRRHRADEVEHLIVELKRPKVKIGHEEITQVENYAISVANDERFRLVNGVMWTFWAISDDVSEYATFRMDDRGVISSKDGISVGIKTWGADHRGKQGPAAVFPGETGTPGR